MANSNFSLIIHFYVIYNYVAICVLNRYLYFKNRTLMANSILSLILRFYVIYYVAICVLNRYLYSKNRALMKKIIFFSLKYIIMIFV